MATAEGANKFNQLQPIVLRIIANYDNMDLAQIVRLFPEEQELANVVCRALNALSLQCILSWYVTGGQSNLLSDLGNLRLQFQDHNFSALKVTPSHDKTDTYHVFVYGKYLLLHWNAGGTAPLDFAHELASIFRFPLDIIEERKVLELETFCELGLTQLRETLRKPAVLQVVYRAVEEWLSNYPNGLPNPTEIIHRQLRKAIIEYHPGMLDVLLKEKVQSVQRFDVEQFANMLHSNPWKREDAKTYATRQIAATNWHQEATLSLLFCSAFSWYHEYLRREDLRPLSAQLDKDLNACRGHNQRDPPVMYTNNAKDPLYQIVYGCYLMARTRESSMPVDLLARIVRVQSSGSESEHAREFLKWQKDALAHAHQPGTASGHGI
ncbi:hypothetical protein CLAFUW4_11604 [Fulvia fulva]|uniref:Uncharacterized protein n=1 Tax=Passalora fulva TaxID=5499 RepID=A0A9Q8PCT2_PASFU|nr:uncharacterized protein CLAFUR5_10649 [Fulvia fulva]KAK4619837.1 hypothetical protein CLAFUR4_11609 [Fulvia fulva]KAK4620503.1 hypothetical protein CLAFUR0_11618 [Fulvia fulva]UJO20057.1 hypothetical protein CLAFUR5_10649 [Fulvia fulva]WPV17674.1 hypothetical protein CLAFUW4_11604 [Fulvia fulva]WPV32597.1 hypothetical protein CLAFUW7_11608 [Fulvia fulva]